MLLNSTSLRSLYTGFSTAFQGGFAGVAPTYTRVAMTVPSSTRTNEYGWLGQIPRIREWIGDRVVQNIGTYGYAIRNRSFELTLGVDRDDIADDNLGMYAPMVTEMGRSTASFPDELVWPLLKAGFVTPCYDKQYFFDTDHPVIDESGRTVSVSNTGGGSGEPWFLIDDSRAVKPIIWQVRQAFDFVRMDAPTDEVVFNRKEYRYGVDGRFNAGFGLWQIAYGSRQPLTADSYLRKQVAVPVAPTTPVLRSCCLALTRYSLMFAGGVEPTEQARLARKEWIEWLQGVADGSIALDGAGSGSGGPAGQTTGARTSDRARVVSAGGRLSW